MLLLLMADLFGLAISLLLIEHKYYSITQVMITGGLVLLAQIAKYTNGFYLIILVVELIVLAKLTLVMLLLLMVDLFGLAISLISIALLVNFII